MTLLMKFKKASILTMSIIFMLACEKKIEFDSDVKSSKLVVNENFNPSENIVIHVSNSLSVIDAAELRSIENADVKIYKGEELMGTLNHTFDGFYQGPFIIPEPETEYTVEVSAPGFESVSAKSFAPNSQLEILNIDTTYFESEFSDRRSLRLDISIRDNDPGENFYGVGADAAFISSETGESYNSEMHLHSSDIVFGASNGDEIYGEELAFDDILLNQNVYILTLNIDNIDGNYYYYEESPGNWVWEYDEPETLYLNILSYSKDLFLFNQSIRSYFETEGDPFSQPTQVYTNVKGGFGIFGGFTETVFEFEL